MTVPTVPNRAQPCPGTVSMTVPACPIGHGHHQRPARQATTSRTCPRWLISLASSHGRCAGTPRASRSAAGKGLPIRSDLDSWALTCAFPEAANALLRPEVAHG